MTEALVGSGFAVVIAGFLVRWLTSRFEKQDTFINETIQNNTRAVDRMANAVEKLTEDMRHAKKENA